MPRWPEGYVARRKQICPGCGQKKDFYAASCRSCQIPAKPLLGMKGPKHPAWKKGQRTDRDGYIRTYDPNHPWPRKGGYVLEHVRVMELYIGRRILPAEAVHHVDENKANNDLSNLELTTHGDHSRYHRLRDTHRRVRDRLGRFAPGKEVSNASN